MKTTPQILVALVAVALATSGSLRAENPDMRPALVGNGPKSLVNLINGKHVMDRGLQHGALFFMARVDPNGFPSYSKIWGGTDEIKPLRDEVHERLAEARFIPAVYHHQNVYAWLYGTVAFTSTGGKPHLRVFANQELPELQKESDFIAPQPIWLPGKIYDVAKLKNPFGGWMTQDKPGMADMLVTVDASGQIKDLKLEHVDPQDKQSYGEEAVKLVQQRMYLPAYRNGKAVESTTHVKFYFIPAFYSLR